METVIRGTGVAMVTPFDNTGEVDFAALGRVVDHVIDGGIDYIVALGTTAESPVLNPEEKRSVASYIRERTASRVPLVLGVGGNDTSDVADKVKRTDLNGFSAVLSVTPCYNKPSQEGLFRHYERIAGECLVPIILYNVPSRTGVNMEPQTTIRIANEIGNVIGIKEACPNINHIIRLLKERPEGFKIISGDDCTAIPMIAMGGDGVISVAANAFPKMFTGMVRAAFSGDYVKASSMLMKFADIFEALSEEGNPTGVKTALAALALIDNNLRLPLVSGSPRLQDIFRKLIEELQTQV